MRVQSLVYRRLFGIFRSRGKNLTQSSRFLLKNNINKSPLKYPLQSKISEIRQMGTAYDIDKEAIRFLSTNDKLKVSFLESEQIKADSSFKIRPPIFKGGSTKDFLKFLYEFDSLRLS